MIANTPHVIVLQTIPGVVVPVYVAVISNILVVVRGIVAEVEQLVAGSTRVVLVHRYTVGMVVLVHIHIVMYARADIQSLAPE